MGVARPLHFGHGLAHPKAIVAMESVALHHRGVHLLSPEDLAEGARNRGGPGAGGTRDGDDRMFGGHAVLPSSGPGGAKQ
jgi:hypothetical protein